MRRHVAFLLASCLTIAAVDCSYFPKKGSYPNIEDVISFAEVDTNGTSSIPPYSTRKFSLDIENINIEKFRQNKGAYFNQISGGQVDPGIDLEFNDSLPSRRGYNLNAIPYFLHMPTRFINATYQMSKTRLMDCILQTIYMARHKIKQMEEKCSFGRISTAYRIAVLYSKITVLRKRLMILFNFMRDNVRHIWKLNHVDDAYYGFRHKSEWRSVHCYLMFHARALRIHVDFLYLWWVIVRLYKTHNQYRDHIVTTPFG